MRFLLRFFLIGCLLSPAFGQQFRIVEEKVERFEPPYDLSGAGPPYLIRVLSSSPISAERLSAAYYLGRLSEPHEREEALLPLFEAFFHDENSMVQRFAGASLERYANADPVPNPHPARLQYLDALLERLKPPGDATLRSQAAVLLGYLNDARSTPTLVEALDDESMHVRTQAARALGRLGDMRALAPLRKKRDATPADSLERPIYEDAYKELVLRVEKILRFRKGETKKEYKEAEKELKKRTAN
ncbi:MAG: HEAT repeat domain-containing protein [Acidobacteriota bacterium]|nr:MAG: HEAT repeat domain-containing protein [Acidobacteriota bacterium]